MNKLRKTLLILFVLLAFGQGSWAQIQYINQLRLVGDGDGLIGPNIEICQDEGWLLVDYDLNKGAGGQYIYLMYKTGLANDPTNPPITDFYIKSTKDKNDHPNTITYQGRTYSRVSNLFGSSSFTSSYGDLNDGAGGRYIYLYYTTDDWDYPRGITTISFNDDTYGAVCGNGSTTPQDLNEGAGGEYIYMHYAYTLTTNVIEVVDQSDFVPLNTHSDSPLYFRLSDHVVNGKLATLSNVVVGNNNTAIIDLNGKGFQRTVQFGGGTDDDHVIKVVDGSKLIIIDSSTEGTGYIAGGNADKGGAFYIDASSELTIDGGVIEYCQIGLNNGYGGAIYNLGTLTINGGTIQYCTATSGWGRGTIYNNGTLTINGGVIQNNTAYYGGAIYNVNGWTTTINGGIIQNNSAAGGTYSDDGIGGGILNYGNLYLNGGTIQGNSCTREGGGIWMTNEGSIFMKGNPVIKDNRIGSTANNFYIPNEHKVIYVVGDFTEGACISFTPQIADDRITNKYCEDHNIGVDPASIFFSDNGYFIKLNGSNEVVQDPSISALTVNYIDADGQEAFYSSCLPMSTVSDVENVALNSGWYVTNGKKTFNHRINVSGNVHLILADGDTLTANKGINVVGNNNITLYGQSRQKGRLVATGENNGAAIGSDGSSSAGAITINGGTIRATGGNGGGAGIGGGTADNGAITINNGNVEATGGNESIGIGGGATEINLNWTRTSIPTEIIKANSYSGTVTLLKAFTDGTDAYPAGLVADNSALANKTLVPRIIFNADGDWNDPTRWNTGKVPGNTDSIFVCAAASIPNAYVAQVKRLTIGTRGSLTIEDGGQLVSQSMQNVTVRKSIHQATNWNLGDYTSDYWYFISSPVKVTNPDFNVAGLYTDGSGGDYDLYRLNNTTWENYKDWGHNHHHFDLEDHRGYLYASKNGTTIEFNGKTNAYTNTSFELSEGFNLVGNPYTFNVYVNRPYYKLNEYGTAVELVTNNAAIMPCSGVVVEYGSGSSLTFTSTPQDLTNSGSLNIVLSTSTLRQGSATSSATLLDKAVVCFNEDSALPKFRFGDKAEIYIPNNGTDFAITHTEAQGEIPLNFKAKENGEYTLTVQSEGMEMNYLHLMDHLTGADVDLLAAKGAEYTFTAQTTDYASRFRLVFISGDAEGESETFAFINKDEIIVNGRGTLQMIDVMGRQFISRQANADLRMPIATFTPGVYVLRLINGKDVKVQKIVIQ